MREAQPRAFGKGFRQVDAVWVSGAQVRPDASGYRI